jgi:hypothetical protein
MYGLKAVPFGASEFRSLFSHAVEGLRLTALAVAATVMPKTWLISLDGKESLDEGHGFSRAVSALRMRASASEVRTLRIHCFQNSSVKRTPTRGRVLNLLYAAGAGRSMSFGGVSDATGLPCTGKRNCNGDEIICLNT